MYAIIETGGKQYRVENGDVITVEKLDAEAGKKVTFDKVLAISDGKDLTVGDPYVSGKTVEGKVIENGKGKKIVVFKYKAKKDSKKKQGHRQPYTTVEISKIGGSAAKASAKAEKKEEVKESEPAAKKEAPAKKEAKKDTVSESMKKDELIKFAEDHDIKIDKKAKKADIVAEIKKAL